MKVVPTKTDFEKVLERKTKLKLKNDGTPTLLALFYFSFAKQVAAESDKLLFMDNRMVMKPQHVQAACRKAVDNFSYAQLVKNKLKNIEIEDQSTADTESYMSEEAS